MSLRKYEQKRDFARTAEPKPKERRRGRGSMFVVQKHDASRLHYDFRLEMEGVLRSWAVPKGFPFKQGERHLAVHVEDHPLDYAKFEGIIPKGQYGGGTVMVWDTGSYEDSDGDAVAAYRAGKLHLQLHGEKLKGEWTLVRGRGSSVEEKTWFLIKTGEPTKPVSKRRDDESILTGRTMREIAVQQTAVWGSKGKPSATPSAARETATATRPRTKPAPPESAAEARFIDPMKATLIKEPPSEDDWLYEVKWDGFRAIAIKNGPNVELISRNEKPLTASFPELRDALATLSAESAVIDGEICALDEQGRPAFQLLQSRNTGTARPPIFFYAFDLLHLNGRDLLKLPLNKRRTALEGVLKRAPEVLRFSASLDVDVHEVLKQIAALGMEGLIGKRRDSLYQPGVRSGAWVKLKIGLEQELVIGGYTPPQGSREHFGALLVGYYEGATLHFAGRVGTGFDRTLLKLLHSRMNALPARQCPFADLPRKIAGTWAQGISPAKARRCTWVRPELVCQIRFTEWTQDGSLRHPVFLGLREDKAAKEVVRERPV